MPNPQAAVTMQFCNMPFSKYIIGGITIAAESPNTLRLATIITHLKIGFNL